MTFSLPNSHQLQHLSRGWPSSLVLPDLLLNVFRSSPLFILIYLFEIDSHYGSHGWPGTCYVSQAGLEPIEILLLLASGVLGVRSKRNSNSPNTKYPEISSTWTPEGFLVVRQKLAFFMNLWNWFLSTERSHFPYLWQKGLKATGCALWVYHSYWPHSFFSVTSTVTHFRVHVSILSLLTPPLP